MTTLTRNTVSSLVLFLVVSLSRGDGPFQITLKFISNKSVRPELPAALATPIGIGRSADRRGLQDPLVLGETTAGRRHPATVVSLTSVPEFVDQVIISSFDEWKVNTSHEADKILRCEILQFSVTEKYRVNANVEFIFYLENRAGKVLWHENISDDDSTYGDFKSEERNYQKVFSNTTKHALAVLFDKTEFREAVNATSK